jgi:hypothetical protein
MAAESEKRDEAGKAKHEWRLAQLVLIGAPLRCAPAYGIRKDLCFSALRYD